MKLKLWTYQDHQMFQDGSGFNPVNDRTSRTRTITDEIPVQKEVKRETLLLHGTIGRNKACQPTQLIFLTLIIYLFFKNIGTVQKCTL